MQHATVEDLEKVDQLIIAIRAIDGLKERQVGHFYYRGKNVIHFHEDKGVIYADIGNEGVSVTDFSSSKILRKVLLYVEEVDNNIHNK